MAKASRSQSTSILQSMNSEYHGRSSLREKEEDVVHKSENCVDHKAPNSEDSFLLFFGHGRRV